MSVIGIDIGTTSICAALLESRDGRPVRIEKRNHAFLDETVYSQDPAEILAVAGELLELLWDSRVTDIAFSSQMHGILFVDAQGRPVTDFYTWKNPWGNEPRGTETYAACVSHAALNSEISGHGVVTALYMLEHGMVPDTAAALCNIGDFVAMQLTGCSKPHLNVTMAESFGCFDRAKGDFRREALEQLGLMPALFPPVHRNDYIYGYYRSARVHAAFGDNQCSFLGSVGDLSRSVLLNVGTGQQVSCFSPEILPVTGVEIRSFFDLGYLYVGVSQNGGKCYERLIRFIESTVRQYTGREIDGYAQTWALWSSRHKTDASARRLPRVVPALYGGIGTVPPGSVVLSDLDAGQDMLDLVEGYVKGMARELYDLYCAIPETIRAEKDRFYAAGNGIVRNRILWTFTEECFQVPLLREEKEEAAAVGAASYVWRK